jgi:hypothetical protein
MLTRIIILSQCADITLNCFILKQEQEKGLGKEYTFLIEAIILYEGLSE